MKTSLIKNALCSIIVLILQSCDYVAWDKFVVINNTENVVVIKIPQNTQNRDNGFHFKENDTVQIIEPGGKKDFFQSLGPCNANYVAKDSYYEDDTIPNISRFDIFIDGKLYNSLRLRSNWEFVSDGMVGTYTLKITPDILEE